MDLDGPAGLKQSAEQPPQWFDEREQLRPEDVAFAHVDDSVRFLGVEAENNPLPQFQRPKRCPSSAAWRRQMRLADVGGQVMLGERGFHAGNQITAVRLVIDMLELAAAAFGKVTAWRQLMMCPERQRAIIEQCIPRNAKRHMTTALGHAVAPRCDA